MVVYNFVDILSHAKTEMDIIKELADKTRAMHEEFCSSCHNSNATSLNEIDIERPAWNLWDVWE